MSAVSDGSCSPLFTPIHLPGAIDFVQLAQCGVSPEMAAAVPLAPVGACTCWGMPFHIERPVLLRDEMVILDVAPFCARWLIFLHTSDLRPLEFDTHGFPTSKDGLSRLGELAVEYVLLYADGSEVCIPIKRGCQLGMLQRAWEGKCTEAVISRKPIPVPSHYEQPINLGWGFTQFRVEDMLFGPWLNWLYAWENPYPERAIRGIRCEPKCGITVLSALTASQLASTPLRWETRRKALLRLPEGTVFDPTLDANGQLAQLRLDLGQVISARPRLQYPTDDWTVSYNNGLPTVTTREVVVEYTAHPAAHFHLPGGVTVPVSAVEEGQSDGPLVPVPPATQRVRIRVVERGSSTPVAVKFHAHGIAGEYLPPVDRHRLPNPACFEDYSADYTHGRLHHCTYITGETSIDLPLGPVYLEVSKGFEIRPLRTVVEVTRATEELVIELERCLHWRERGWVSADTHTHFLQPPTLLLEGAGEGVNVVNLLATQLGELMSNVGDFDGKTTYGTRESGGEGEYLVRVGTENRQHVLGHISLLGYRGNIITPLTTGGPDESALGDPVEVLLTEWAQQCKRQGGLVVLSHFPFPRMEHAAVAVSGQADAVEMVSWNNLYAGIDPYSLVDWYRFLNCGYMLPAVGGTDKMSAETAVGTVRTYARLRPDEEFTYDAWMEAVRRGETFVTYGPLLEFAVDGKPAGATLPLPAGGGTLTVSWKLSSVTVPMSRVELIVNGEVRESRAIKPDDDAGEWDIRMERSGWLAILVRGHYPDKPVIITAHSSPVLAQVDGSSLLAAADALTILAQIEGSLAFLDTLGTRKENETYQRMRLVLTSAHRSLHNRLHAEGQYHQHTAVDDHAAHHDSP